MARLRYMAGKEFIHELLEGNTNFRNRKLEENCDLNSIPLYKELYIFLRSHDHKNYPIDISGSDLRGLKAIGLYMPHIIAEEVDLSNSYLQRVNFSHGNLQFAKLWDAEVLLSILDHTHLSCARLPNTRIHYTELLEARLDKVVTDANTAITSSKLIGASMRGARIAQIDLTRSELTAADVYNTDFAFTTLTESDISHLRNLEHSMNLETALFSKTKMSENERVFIRKLRKNSEMHAIISDGSLDEMQYARDEGLVDDFLAELDELIVDNQPVVMGTLIEK